MRLEYTLTRILSPDPLTEYIMVREVSKLLPVDAINTEHFPIVEWYIDFAGSRTLASLREIPISRLVSIWRQLPPASLRDRLFRLMLLVESVLNEDSPQSSSVCLLLRGNIFDQSGAFTENGRHMAAILLGEALGSPPVRAEGPDMGKFALLVLRESMVVPYEKPDPTLIESIVALAGNVSDRLRAEMRRILS